MLDLRSRLEFPCLELIRENNSDYEAKVVALNIKGELSPEQLEKFREEWSEKVKESEQKKTSQLPRGCDLYKLGWYGQEKRIEFRRKEASLHYDPVPEWAKHKPEPSLPLDLDKKVKNLRFAINRQYVNEIKRNCRIALFEWNIPRSFDTSIRELCLKPAIAHVFTAFELLGDCVWDEQKGKYSRDNWKYYCFRAMVYKFWCHQTGSGLLLSRAKIEETKRRIEGLRLNEYHPIKPGKHDEEADELEKFVKALEEHQDALCNPAWKEQTKEPSHNHS